MLTLILKGDTFGDVFKNIYFNFMHLCTCIPNFSYPLIHLPIPGSLPIAQWVSTPNYTSTNQFIEEPYCYVQQVVLRTTVVPWSQDLNLGDAFRAPIYESFKLLDTVRNYQEEQRYFSKDF